MQIAFSFISRWGSVDWMQWKGHVQMAFGALIDRKFNQGVRPVKNT